MHVLWCQLSVCCMCAFTVCSLTSTKDRLLFYIQHFLFVTFWHLLVVFRKDDVRLLWNFLLNHVDMFYNNKIMWM